MTAPTAPAPGYYTDPLDPGGERWWDGSAWTETVRPAARTPAVAVPELEPEPVAVVAESIVVPLVEPDQGRVEVSSVVVPAVEPVRPVPDSIEQPPAQVPETASSAVPPGLYPDPYGQAALRWWDGQQWTTQTSQPLADPPGVPVSGTPTVPAFLPSGTGGSTVVPARAQARTHGAAMPGRRAARGGRTFPTRRRLADLSRHLGWKSLVGVLVVVLALGVRLYFVFDSGSSTESAPSSIASAVNLRSGDLPKTWAVQSSANAFGQDSDPTGDSFQRDIDRCTGAPVQATSVTYTGVSQTWTRGASQLSSEVTVLRTPALAQQDLRAQQGPKVISCVTKVGTPALKRVFAAKGVTLAGLSVSRLPNAPADGFSLRMKMTLSAHGRTLTVWNDAYGFVRGTVEVSLTSVSTGNAPDRTVAAQALQKLRARTTGAVPASS